MRSLFANIFTTVHADLAAQAASFLLPWKRSQWKTGNAQGEFVHAFRDIVGIDEDFCVIPMYNARSALYHGLKTLDIGAGDEIVLQAYTCVSVPNAIIATGAKPVYTDIDIHTANIDPELIEAAITPNTKAILIQHTFGIVADLERIQAMCKKHDLLLIEDCAHALGATHLGKSVGTFGDMALFSLGRDKILTTTNGGILVLPKKYATMCEHIEKSLTMPSNWVILQNLLYLLLGWLAYISYDLKVGKVLYYFAAKAKLLPLIITSAEKSCTFTNFSLGYPNVLAKLAYEELKRLPNITAHRRSGAKMYVDVLGDAVLAPLKDGDVYLRIIYKTQQQKACIIEAKKQGFHLGDPRYDTVIAGRSVDFDDAQYLLGSCPRAEELAGKTLNLPNHMLMEKSDYKRVIEFVSHFTTTT